MEKSDQDSSSNRNHSPRQSDSPVPAAAAEAKMESPNESEMKQSHSVTESQDQSEEEEEDLPSQPQTPSSVLTEFRKQDVTPPQTLPVNRNQEAESNDDTPSKQRRCQCQASRCLKLYCSCFASGSYCNGCYCVTCHNTLEYENTSRQEAIKATLERNPDAFKPKVAGSPRGLKDLQPKKIASRDDQEAESPSKQRRCSCKVSRCLKLYCECFASGSYCNGCNCLHCQNNLEYETTSRQEAIMATLERNPNAFNPKIAGSPYGGLDDFQEDVRQLVILGKHSRGCNCKRSGCLKKYCECYHANVRCSENCRCQDCKNFEVSQEIQQTTNASPESIKKKIKAASSHSVAARGSPNLVQNQTVEYVRRDGDTSLFTVPNNQAVPGSTASTYRSSLSDTNQLRQLKELCSLLVSKSVDVANKMSGGRMDEKPMSSATGALMSDEEHVNISEKETSARESTSQEKEDKDASSEVYAEQERQILSCFKDSLMQLVKQGSINGRNIQKGNTDPSRKEPEDEEQSHRD